MPNESEDITFQETQGLSDSDIEDIAATDPELATEVDDGTFGNDLDDADSESDDPPEDVDNNTSAEPGA